ncbi:tetratricopeptide repeat protein [Paraburkholderia hayleyella]|uniref:tetratricopeptide repeat protein n=1 Tax=Paraburkholderia hayleyella TaxID=2152889 RepID=UPI0012925CCF|nr:tetratricopeptide repeat protein [Paraburkholderia hayleyella]
MPSNHPTSGIAPDTSAPTLLTAALEAHRNGQLTQAETLYQQTLAQAPQQADALHYYGVLQYQRGAYQAAAALLDQALAINPHAAECINNRGLIAAALGDPKAALQAYQTAAMLRPDYTDAWFNLAQALSRLKRFDEARACYDTLLTLEPGSADACFSYGNLLNAAGDASGAIERFRQALALQPDFTRAHVNLGSALGNGGAYQEAEHHYRQAVALDPAPAHLVCLGAALGMQGRHDEEEAFYQQALALDPEQADARQNLAWLYLKRGDYLRGWAEYAKRWRPADYSAITADGIAKWQGEPLAGRRLLIVGEQGFGDHFQFLRFARQLEEHGAHVEACVREPLLEIIQRTPGLKRAWSGPPRGHYDFWVSMMDLPFYLGTELSSIPADIPYLFTDPEKIAAWQPRVEAAARHKRARVGLAWQGSPAGLPSRMMPFATLAPLCEDTDIAWFSLQKGPARHQTDTVPASLRPIDFTDDLHNFADTAALIMNLDLVLTIDTGIAHLAGALGKPVWIMLPVGADWRWLDQREDSPWYPTARLFRQLAHDDWPAVIARVREALRTTFP